MNVVLDEFRKNHVDIVNLDVSAEQEAAVGLCRSLGFSIRAYNMRKRLYLIAGEGNRRALLSSRHLSPRWRCRDKLSRKCILQEREAFPIVYVSGVPALTP